jgi:hypothetical protein
MASSNLGYRPRREDVPFGAGPASGVNKLVAYTEPFGISQVLTVDEAYVTLTAAQLLRSSVIRSTHADADAEIELPSVATLVAGLGSSAAAGVSLRFTVINAADKTKVIVWPGSGMTTIGHEGTLPDLSVGAGRTAAFLVALTDVAAGSEAATFHLLSRSEKRLLGGSDGSDMTLVFPLYQYPSYLGHYFEEAGWVQARLGSRMILIINPNNGNDATSAPNADWVSGLGAYNSFAYPSDGNCMGYTYVSYAARDINEVKAVIDGYAAHWGSYVSGLFVDECPSALGADLAYVTEVAAYAASKGMTRVMLNPGTGVPEEYTQIPGVTHVVSTEETAASWPGYSTQTYQLEGSDPSKFVAMVNTVTDERTIDGLLQEARRRNFGGFFATERSDYNEAPSFFMKLANRFI